MKPLTKELEKEQNRLIEKKDIYGCIKFLKDNNVDCNKIAKLVFKYGDSWDCTITLLYGEGLEPAISNKLALKVYKYNNVGDCVYILKYVKEIKANIKNKLALKVYRNGKQYDCSIVLIFATDLYPKTIEKLKERF